MLMVQWNQKFQNFLTLKLLSSRCTSLKYILKQFKKQSNFDFIVPQLHLSRQKDVKNVSAIYLIYHNQTFMFKI